MENKFDVIVVGVGAMGASTCWELARRGVRVLGLEQFDIPHTRGSSHGFSRMIRMAYYEHPDYVPLLRRAYERWEQLEKATGQKLLYITGGLYMGWRESEVIAGSLAAAQQYQLAHELIEHADLKTRYPQFELPADHVGLLEPRAGFLVPERVISAYAEDALASGAEIHGQEAVQSWGPIANRMTVKTNRASYEADQLIFCGGAWTTRLVRDLGIDLVVTRQVMGWVWPKQPSLFEIGTLPVWAIDSPRGSIWYGFPITDEPPGFKIALHARGSVADPDQVNREISPDDEKTFRECLTGYIPRADGPVLSMRTCLYTNSPDSHFIIDRHPRLQRVLLACGFSGHGFKFASVVGEVLADYATRGKTDLPARFLGLSRFTGG
jgi:sarcosine oxidase